MAGLTILLLIAFFLYRNNRKEKKAKNVLKQKNEVIEQTLDPSEVNDSHNSSNPKKWQALVNLQQV